MFNNFRLDFSTRLLNNSGSGRGDFNPFNFEPNTNATGPDLFDSPIDLIVIVKFIIFNLIKNLFLINL